MSSEVFDWNDVEPDDRVIEEQCAVVVYRNRHGHVVVRASSLDPQGDDPFFVLTTPAAAQALGERLLEEANQTPDGERSHD